MSFLNRFLPDRPQDAALSSVVRNLNYLLSARAGFSSPLVDFGLSDYHEQQGATATLTMVMKEIVADIGRFEPRLRVRELKLVGHDNELHVHFHLRGELMQGGRRTPCRIHIIFDPVYGGFTAQALEAADER